MKEKQYKYSDLITLVQDKFSFLEHEFGFTRPVITDLRAFWVITYLRIDADIGVELMFERRDNYFKIELIELVNIECVEDYNYDVKKGSRAGLFSIIHVHYDEEVNELNQIQRLNEARTRNRTLDNINTLIHRIDLEQKLLKRFIDKIINDRVRIWYIRKQFRKD